MSMPHDNGGFQGGGPPPPPPGYAQAGPGGYPPPPGSGGKTGWVVAGIGCAIAGVFGLIILGILAAIAIPNFIRFQAKAKQAEAKTNLGAIFTSQSAYYDEYATYAHTFEQLGWAPWESNSYAYFVADDAIQPTKPGMGRFSLPDDLKPYSTDQGFMVIAVGNVDRDDDLDVWIMDETGSLRNPENDLTSYQGSDHDWEDD